jgi:NAD(P)-dependent dehydrogenase (short-subunit alcohol dehydrogenase family)
VQKKLEKQVAIITGAGSGIGRATAELFAREGARVVVADLNKGDADQTAKRINDSQGESFARQVDVADPTQVQALVEETISRYGKIDILHNNAGMIVVKFLEDMDESEWDRLMGVNLKSIFLAVKYAIGYMKRQKSGCIINTASTGSFLGQYMTPAYIASKGGVLMLTKTLALDYAQYNIRVNCICPGAVDTQMLRQHFSNSESPKLAAEREMALIPIKRFLDPSEIAAGALYLASEAARGITGTALSIDGGSLAGFYSS